MDPDQNNLPFNLFTALTYGHELSAVHFIGATFDLMLTCEVILGLGAPF